MKTIQDDIDRQQSNPNAFHRFLLANRPYCALCSGPYPSTQIKYYKGQNTAVCDAHARSLEPPTSYAANPEEADLDPWKYKSKPTIKKETNE